MSWQLMSCPIYFLRKRTDRPLENRNKKQNYLAGAAILSVSTILVKIIGMLYKIPLKRLIGDANFGYFNTAYEIYTVMLVISITGLPVAMSRLVSEARALGNGRQVKRIYQTALLAYLVIGLLGSGVMMLFPRWLATDVMHNPGSYYSILALGPAVLCICIASACRGFFQGQGNMVPTAVSQVIEALCKLVLGLSLAWLVLRRTGDGPLTSGATILGITVGSVLSAVYLVVSRRRASRSLDALGGKARPMGETMKSLLSIAVPITIGAAGLQIINLIDSSTIMSRMLSAAEQVQAGSESVMGRLLSIAAQKNPEDLNQYAADIAKGVYNFCQTIFNFPLAFIPNITASIIPAITNHLTLKNMRGVRMVQDSSLRLMGLIALPCTVGMFVLAKPIIQLLGGYSGDLLSIAAMILALLSFTILITSISNMASAIMQAHGFVFLPVINTIIGGILKVIMNYILVGNPNIAIIGAPISTFLCFFVVMALNLFAMRRVLRKAPKVLPNIWRSGLAALVMSGVTYLVYRLAGMFVSSVVISCGFAILVAVVVYCILIVAFRAITYDDCMFLPKGEKIAKILRIR